MQAQQGSDGIDSIDTSSLNRAQKRAFEKQKKKGFSKPPMSTSAMERQKLLSKKFKK